MVKPDPITVEEILDEQLPVKKRNSASEVIVPHKFSTKDRSQTKVKEILNHLDNVPDVSEKESSNSGDGLKKKRGVREVKFVDYNDMSVQLGFERLGRLLQFLKKPLDQMESVVLEGKFR